MNVDALNEALSKKRALRDEYNMLLSQAIRNCGRAILYTHRGEVEKAKELISKARNTRSALRSLLPENPRMYSSFLNLEQELVEAEAFIYYYLNKDILPRRDFFPESYVLGLADLIGELRRLSIEKARAGNLEEASRILEDAESLYIKLREIDYTTVKELRHKLDVYRRSLSTRKEELALIEAMRKTRS